MKTKDTDLKKLLPLFMRDDQAVREMAEAINEIMSHAKPAKLRTWDQLDEMTHEELDDLAWELNVLWYNQAGTLAQKREQIRTSDDVWRTLGTKYAVETVVTQLFKKGKVLEFWEYEGGQPHHFAVECHDPSVVTPEGEKEFRRILEMVKRKSQILDAITIIYSPNFFAYTGVAVYDTTKATYSFNR